jgi:hypothetical protein
MTDYSGHQYDGSRGWDFKYSDNTAHSATSSAMQHNATHTARAAAPDVERYVCTAYCSALHSALCARGIITTAAPL